jgi:hypothetical protein
LYITREKTQRKSLKCPWIGRVTSKSTLFSLFYEALFRIYRVFTEIWNMHRSIKIVPALEISFTEDIFNSKRFYFIALQSRFLKYIQTRTNKQTNKQTKTNVKIQERMTKSWIEITEVKSWYSVYSSQRARRHWWLNYIRKRYFKYQKFS